VAAAKAAAAALKLLQQQQQLLLLLLLLLRARELYVSVVLAGMAEAQRELGLCLAGLDEGACTRGACCPSCRSDRRRRLRGRRPHYRAIAHS
jgi:hypothetical protein